MLRFEGLFKQYRSFPMPRMHGGPRPEPVAALNGLDLEVRRGEIVGLVGLNGAGKTTAIRIAAGVTLPTQGTVWVDGHDIVREKLVAAQYLGWVTEFPNFEPQARALDLLEYFAGFHRMSGPETLRWCAEVLQLVGLGGHELERLGSYSQGMKKRFSLASALLGRPTNLLLDELLNGLDPRGIRAARGLLLALRDQGRSILLSSHVLSEVQQVADRVAFVHKGRVIKVISRDELASAPGTRLRIVLREPVPAAVAFLEKAGRLAVDGRTLLLEDPRVEADEINDQLVRRGARVVELHTETEDLESYFFRLIGEAS